MHEFGLVPQGCAPGWAGPGAVRAGRAGAAQEAEHKGRKAAWRAGAWSRLHIIWLCCVAYLWVFGWLQREHGGGSCPGARQDRGLAWTVTLHLCLLLLSSEKYRCAFLMSGRLLCPKLGRNGQSTIFCLLLLFLRAFLAFVLSVIYFQLSGFSWWMKHTGQERVPTDT